jgi:hypothetical protein
VWGLESWNATWRWHHLMVTWQSGISDNCSDTIDTGIWSIWQTQKTDLSLMSYSL